MYLARRICSARSSIVFRMASAFDWTATSLLALRATMPVRAAAPLASAAVALDDPLIVSAIRASHPPFSNPMRDFHPVAVAAVCSACEAPSIRASSLPVFLRKNTRSIHSRMAMSLRAAQPFAAMAASTVCVAVCSAVCRLRQSVRMVPMRERFELTISRALPMPAKSPNT